MNLDKLLADFYEEFQKLQREKRESEAIFTFENITSQALNVLALSYVTMLHDDDKALSVLRFADTIIPSNYLIWSNITKILTDSGQYEKAIEASFKAIKFCNRLSAEPHFNAAIVFSNLKQYKEAEMIYRAGLEIDPNAFRLKHNLGFVILGQNICQEGWELYESRLDINEDFKKRITTPKWNGEKYESLLVYNEQGLGDLIFFSRFLPQIKAMGKTLICEAQEPVAPCLGDNLGIDQIITRPNHGHYPEIPKTQYAVSIASLPKILQIDSEDKIPNDPYIFAPKRKRPDFFEKNKFNIGLCWAGNPKHKKDNLRSIPIKHFEPLMQVPNTQFYALIKDSPSKRESNNKKFDVNEDIEKLPIISLENQIHDFNDLAHFINHLDLIITVDTSVVHLAGAMGKPTWMLIGKDNDFRWGYFAAKTPWYPSVQIYRYDDTCDEIIKDFYNQLNDITMAS